jgi:phage repressor protein C with HTH and peptisase S24 domain/transcriptional regulator with XRE-family HTH domain
MGLEDDLRGLRELRQQVKRQLGSSETFGQRLRQLRRERGLKLDDLARAAGISKPYLSQIETGHADPPREDKIRRLEDALGLRPRTLLELAQLARAPDEVRRRLEQLHSAFSRAEETVELLAASVRPSPSGEDGPSGPGEGLLLHPSPLTGEGRVRVTSVAPATEPGAPDASLSPQTVRHVIPIINRVAAGYPAEFTDLDYPAGIADDYIGQPPGLDDPHAFAVRVVGDSMEPRYREGDIVLFSPAATVRSGDDCYVRFAPESPRGSTALFKRVYFDDADTVRLQPLNERYPPALVPLSEVAGLYRAAYRYETL